MQKYLDGWLHAVGVANIQSVKVAPSDESLCRVDVMFMGGELVLSVPRAFVINAQGVPMFQEGDDAFLDIRLGITSNTKTFEGNSYSKMDITVKKVMEFRRLTAEESKAL